MGVIKFFSSSSFDREECQGKIRSQVDEIYADAMGTLRGNPNPKNFKIINYKRIENFSIIKINYPESTNYEGNKILIFDGPTFNDLIKQGSIDPHFSDNKKYHSPIARFEPTTDGWNNAILFIKSKLEDDERNKSR